MKPERARTNRPSAVAVLCAALCFLFLHARADIVSLKDGSVVECIIRKTGVRNGRQVVIVELEDGRTREIAVDKVAWMARGKPSWVIRKENLEWYRKRVERKAKKLESSWKENFNLGRACKSRKYLDEQAEKHLRKAYELRLKETDPEIKDHEKLALWLERSCGLFGLALEEWSWVYKKRLDEMKAAKAEKGQEPDDDDWYKLGRWAEKHSLYDQAMTCYETAVKLEPRNRMASRAIERIKRLRETMINAKLFRTIKTQFSSAVASYARKQNGDGSYGGDATEGGVQGLRAMTALCGLGLIEQWEVDALERPEVMKSAPREIERVIGFLLKAECNKKKLRGPDVWGNMWSLHFFAKVLQKRQMKGYHEQIKQKLNQIFDALAKQQSPRGGWMYYDFARNSPASFVTATGIMGMIELKEVGAAVPDQLYNKALSALKTLKQSDGVWMYRTGARQKVEGCQGRASLCELALYRAGQGSLEGIRAAVANFFRYHHILEAVKGKKATHIGSGGTAPYYYLFGHYWTARACHALPAAERDANLTRLRDIFLKDQEPDGTFSDFPMIKKHHKIYGAAFGAMTLYTIGTLPRKAIGARR